MADEKYVHIEGRVTIEPVTEPVTGEPALKLIFVDKDFKPQRFPDGRLLEPIFLYLTEDGMDRPVRFKHVSFVAEFVETGYARVKDTLEYLDPYIGEWAGFEASKDDERMNPSGPPKP